MQLRRFFAWFARTHYRPFPWRSSSTTPFGILIAEVLLRQTKADDVVPVWRELMRRFPTPDRLRRVSNRVLAAALRPLGLQNQRAGALRALAATLVRKHDGGVPRSLAELLALPHVGMYSASAVHSFAFGARVPIVDSNIIRFLARLTGIALPRDVRRSPSAWSLAWAALPRRNIALHNYGLLDFTGLVCTPRAPRCPECGLRMHCAFAQRRGADLPAVTAPGQRVVPLGSDAAVGRDLPSPG